MGRPRRAQRLSVQSFIDDASVSSKKGSIMEKGGEKNMHQGILLGGGACFSRKSRTNGILCEKKKEGP